MFIRCFTISVLSAAMLASAVSASALTATQKVEKEIVVTQSDGTSVTQRVSADEVTPGEKVMILPIFSGVSLDPYLWAPATLSPLRVV